MTPEKILTNETGGVLFHATNALLSPCSSSGSEALLFLIFLPRMLLTGYLSPVWTLYSP